MVRAHSTNKDEHGNAMGDAVLAQTNQLCSSRERAGGRRQNQEEREEGKGESRQAFRQARGSNTIHVLGAEH